MIHRFSLALACALALTASMAQAARLKADEVHTLAPLRYRVLASGGAAGAHPTRAQQVKVRYTGRFVDGKTFDSSTSSPDGTATFPLGRLIPGWVVALQLMRPGDHWEITVPPEMAYGEKGAGEGVIPPNATLVFDVELVDILPPAPPAG